MCLLKIISEQLVWEVSILKCMILNFNKRANFVLMQDAWMALLSKYCTVSGLGKHCWSAVLRKAQYFGTFSLFCVLFIVCSATLCRHIGLNVRVRQIASISKCFMLVFVSVNYSVTVDCKDWVTCFEYIQLLYHVMVKETERYIHWK